MTGILNFLDELEALGTEIASKLAPWLAPLLSAVVVGKAMMNPPFDWALWLAVLTGAAIELSGIATLSTALMLWSYRSVSPHRGSVIPLILAVSCAFVYLFTAFALTVVLKIMPGLEVLAYGLFVLLALTSAVNLSLRRDHLRRRVVSNPALKAKRTRSNKKRSNLNGSNGFRVRTPVPDQTDEERWLLLERANESKGQQIEERRAQVLCLTQAGKSKPEIADELGVSISTIKRDIYALNGQVTNYSGL